MSERRPHGPVERRVEEAVERVRRAVVLAVLVMIAVGVLVSAGDIAWALVRELAHPRGFGGEALLEIFSLILLVLIGVELLETVHGALDRPPVVQAETVLLAALVAVARGVIVGKAAGAGTGYLLAYAALVVALAAAVLLLRLGRRPQGG